MAVTAAPGVHPDTNHHRLIRILAQQSGFLSSRRTPRGSGHRSPTGSSRVASPPPTATSPGKAGQLGAQLLRAASGGDFGQIKQLVLEGANLEVTAASDMRDKTALLCAAANGHIKVAGKCADNG